MFYSLRWMSFLFFSIFVSLTLFQSIPALAASFTYVGKASDTQYCPDEDARGDRDTSKWDHPCNWDPKGTPGAGASVLINGPAPIIRENRTVGSLTLSGGRLQVTSTNTLTVGGELTWTGGTIIGPGVVNIPGSAKLTITGPADKALNDGGEIHNHGTATWNGGNISGYRGSTLINFGTFLSYHNGSFIDTDGGNSLNIISNRGVFHQIAGHDTTRVGWVFNNLNVVESSQGGLALGGGSLGGNTVGGHSGTFLAGEGAWIDLSGGNHFLGSDVRFIGAGRTRLTGGHLFTQGTPNVGIPGGAGGTFEIRGGKLNPGHGVGGNALPHSGALVVSDTGKLLLTGGSLGGPVNVLSGGESEWTGGEIAGTLNVEAGGSLNITGEGVKTLNGYNKGNYGNQTLPGILNNAGTTTWEGAGKIHLRYQAEIHNTGTFIARNDSAFDCDGYAVTITNSGTFRKTDSTGETQFNKTCNDIIFTTTGTMDVQSGSVTFNNTRVNLDEGAAFSGAGRTRLVSGNYKMGGNLTVREGGTLELAGGRLNGTGTVHGPGLLNWTGGEIEGTLAIAPGGLLTLTGGGVKLLDGYGSQDGILNNAGLVIWEGIGPLQLNYGATFNNSGTFLARNDAVVKCDGYEVWFNNSGTFRKEAGAGETRLDKTCNDLHFNNTGTVDARSGAIVFNNTGTAAGTFNAAAGTFIDFILSRVNWTLSDGAAFTGPGRTRLKGPKLVFRTGENGPATVQIAEGATLEYASGEMSGTGTVAGPGALAWTGGEVRGVLTTGNDTKLLISGDNNRVLSGYNSYFGGNPSTTGVLNNGGVATWTGMGDIQFEYTGAFHNTGTLNVQTEAAFLNNGVLTNAGTINIQSGTLSYGQTLTQTAGSTTLAGGNLSLRTLDLRGGNLAGAGIVTGSVNNTGGTVNPVSTTAPGTASAPGLLTITGTYTQAPADAATNAPGGALRIDLFGSDDDPLQYDRLQVNGKATLNGTLIATLAEGFTPANTDLFEVLPYGSHQGNFGAVTVQGLDPQRGIALQPLYESKHLALATQVTKPTPAGSNVTVDLGNVLLEYLKILEAGMTSTLALNAETLGAAPEGYTILPNAPALDISTTVPFEGMIEIRIRIPDEFLALLTDEQINKLSVLHGKEIGGKIVWEDQTSIQFDPATKTIVVRTPSLSPFVVAIGPGALPFALGDVDKSGAVNVSDAVIVLKASVNQVTLTTEEQSLADVDKSGSVNVGDAVQILRKSVGLPASF
ncbi:MAG: hypothetical protein KY468_03175 [Armatimonadetes bacterium]|nr:hypothetical protein [Armatimonadota bacterium]